MEVTRKSFLKGLIGVVAGSKALASIEGDLSPNVEKFYDRELLEKASPHLEHIKFRRYDSLPCAITPLSEGIAPTRRRLGKIDI